MKTKMIESNNNKLVINNLKHELYIIKPLRNGKMIIKIPLLVNIGTKEIIPDLKIVHKNNNSWFLNYWVTQALTKHGNFGI